MAYAAAIWLLQRVGPFMSDAVLRAPVYIIVSCGIHSCKADAYLKVVGQWLHL